MGLGESLHTLMIRKNLRNAHVINKSYIVHHTSYMANAFSNAFALNAAYVRFTRYDVRFGL